MSELQAGTITRINDTEEIRFHTAGRATPGTELRIMDDDQQILGPNEEGELYVRGLSVFDAYLNKTEETRKVLTKDGWFRTGDTACLTDHGHLKITGRTKNVINRGGVKYNPIEIENIISDMTEVNQCAIIPMKDERLGEIACVFIVLNDNTTINLSDICQTLDQADIAKYKWPEQLRVINEMPLTPTNKIKVDELSKQLAK